MDPVDKPRQQHPAEQSDGVIPLRPLELLPHMGEGFQPDETPEHHRQRSGHGGPLVRARQWPGRIAPAHLPLEPDKQGEPQNGERNQQLQIAGGARPAQPQQKDPEQGQQLDGPEGPLPHLEQGVPETGGNHQGGGQTHRQHRQKEESGEALGAVAKGEAYQMRRTARVGIAAAEAGEGKGDGQHQRNQQQPGPERGPTRQRGGGRRYHEDPGAEQRGGEQPHPLPEPEILFQPRHILLS